MLLKLCQRAVRWLLNIRDSIANIAADYDLSASGLLGMSIAELEDMLQELLAAENKDENLIAEVREVIALKKRLNNQT